jgi:sigma-E factor negative regulatory protein RseC
VTEMPGLVLRTEDDFAYVEIAPRQAGCGRCHEVGGCGADAGAGGSGGKRVYRLPNAIGVCSGDQVMLTVADGALLKASLYAYLLPIVLVIVGAAIGTTISETAAVIAAGIGLAVGMVLTRYAQSRMLATREPLLRMRIKNCAFNSSKDHNLC